MIPVSFTQVGLGPVSSIQSSILQNGEEMDRFKCLFFTISYTKILSLVNIRQACSPLIQLFFGFASDFDQTNINRDIRDGNWLAIAKLKPLSLFISP